MKLHIHNNKCIKEFSVRGFNKKRMWFGICREILEVVYSRPHGNTDQIKALENLVKIIKN